MVKITKFIRGSHGEIIARVEETHSGLTNNSKMMYNVFYEDGRREIYVEVNPDVCDVGRRELRKIYESPIIEKNDEPKNCRECRNRSVDSLNFDAYNSDPKNIAIRDLSVQLYSEQKRAEEEKKRAKENLREQKYAKASRLGKFLMWFDRLTETVNDGWNNR